MIFEITEYLALIFGFTINSNDVSGLGLWRWPRLSRWHRWGWVKVQFVVKIFGRIVNLFGFDKLFPFCCQNICLNVWQICQMGGKVNKMPDLYHCHNIWIGMSKIFWKRLSDYLTLIINNIWHGIIEMMNSGRCGAKLQCQQDQFACADNKQWARLVLSIISIIAHIRYISTHVTKCPTK